MPTTPDASQPLSKDAQALLDRLSRHHATALFDLTAATELIEHGYARRSNGGINITAVGLQHHQTS